MTAQLEATLDRLDDAGRALLFTEAHTANTFAPVPVSDEELTDIWELAKWAPTMANTQPLRVLFVRPGEGRERLVAHMADGNKEKTLSAPAVAVLAVDTQFHEHIPTVMPFMPQLQDALAANDEMRAKSGTYSGALQAGYFILAVRAAGLAVGPMAGFDGPGIDAEFFPDGRWQSALVVNIGHPAADAFRPRQARLGHDHVIKWA